MSILDKVNSVGRVANEKAKNVSDSNNLKRKITYEEERIVEIFTELGKKYYKNPNEDATVFKTLCDDIDTRRRRIKKMRFEFSGLKGYKLCPKCGAEVNCKFQFCGACGCKILDPNDDSYEEEFMKSNDDVTKD